MLRVTVELVPLGDESRKRIIAGMRIGNIGRNPKGGYNYDIELTEEGNPELDIPRKERRLTVTRHNRRNSVWDLIVAAIEADRQEP